MTDSCPVHLCVVAVNPDSPANTHQAPVCSATPPERSGRGQRRRFPLFPRASTTLPTNPPTPVANRQSGPAFLASHNAPLRPSPADPGGHRLSITGFSWALASSGYGLQDVREASERSPGSAYGFISVHSWRLIKLAILLLF